MTNGTIKFNKDFFIAVLHHSCERIFFAGEYSLSNRRSAVVATCKRSTQNMLVRGSIPARDPVRVPVRISVRDLHP